MSVHVVALTVRTTVAPAVAAGGELSVDVDVASDQLGEQTFSATLPAWDFAFLDRLEDLVNDGPQTPDDLGRIGEQQAVLGQVGQELFDRTLGRWGQWPTLLGRARDEGAGVRIVLRTSSSAVAALPWELLRDGEGGGFLALERGVTVVRNPQRLGPVPALTTTRPLRVLMCGSTPSDLGRIDVAGELAMLSSVLGGLGGSVEAYRLTESPDVCTFDQLEAALDAQGPWHIVHFSGHGGFDGAVGGLLAFTTPEGRVDSIPASQFGALLAAHRSLRLVVINACRGAMGVGRQMTDSVAGALVHRGVPACVSMQFEVTDRAALPFARAFFGAIVGHGDVDVAVSDARRAISEVSLMPGHPIGSAQRSTEWATPVLHLESVDPQLFPPSAPVAAPGPRGRIVGAPAVAERVSGPVHHRGALTEVSRMHWRLEYSTDLAPPDAMARARAAVASTLDVRKAAETAGRFEAAVGGVFPGAWAATETVTVEVRPANGGTTVTIASRPRQSVLIDNGRNRAALQRIAQYLGVEV